MGKRPGGSASPKLGMLSVVALLLTSCQHTIRVDNWDTFSVVLERTACFGTCPVYMVKIDGSGLVEYTGRLNVDVLASRTAKIEPNAVKNLVRSFNEVQFLGLRNNYSELCTDMPTTIITLSYDGKTKRVSNYYGGCEGEKTGPQVDLARLADQIDSTAGTAHWVKCTDGCLGAPGKRL